MLKREHDKKLPTESNQYMGMGWGPKLQSIYIDIAYSFWAHLSRARNEFGKISYYIKYIVCHIKNLVYKNLLLLLY